MLIERGDIGVAPQFAIRIANHVAASAAGHQGFAERRASLAVPYDLCIPENAKNPTAAKAYINFTLTAPIQTALTTSLLATPVRSDIVDSARHRRSRQFQSEAGLVSR